MSRPEPTPASLSVAKRILDARVPTTGRLCVNRVIRATRPRFDTASAPCASAGVLEIHLRGPVHRGHRTAAGDLWSKQIDGAFEVKRTPSGRSISWGNAVIGLRNPSAPPLVIHRDKDDRRWTDFHLGAAYEGPPGHVHGGVSALVLDHVLGEAASPDSKPRFTGSITVRYLRACPLGPLHAEAQITRVDGVKTFVSGYISDAEGITVEAEGVFITPRWLRD